MVDVVMEYSYGRSDHRLEQEDFGPDYHDAVVESGRAGSLLKQMIWIYHFVQSLPEWVAVRLSPSLDLILRIQRVRHNLRHNQSSTDWWSLTIPTANGGSDHSNQSSAFFSLSRPPSSDSLPRDSAE